MGNPLTAKIIDRFDGWMVLDVDKLKQFKSKLDPKYRSLKVISKYTGIAIPQLSSYFSGKRTPNLRNFKKLCLYLQAKSDDLMGLEEINTSDNI